MSSQKKYKKNSNCVSTKLNGEYVLLHLETGEYLKINESGAFIWDLLDKHMDSHMISTAVSERYEINLQQSQEDVAQFLSLATEKNILDLSDN